MEESVALNPDEQKKFVKSIKGIKKLLKSGQVEINENETPHSVNIKKKITERRKKKEKGLVYLSRIPHGFYEKQMSDYFKQFGGVTNVRVIRSKRTGRSKGHAFVEFADTNVAQIAAETMNNYLMGKRLLKASYIPPGEQRMRALRKKWNRFNCPGNEARIKIKKNHNADKSEDDESRRIKKILSNLKNTNEKLTEMGIDYSWFKPVDVPEKFKGVIEGSENEGSEQKIKKKKSKEVKPKQKFSMRLSRTPLLS